MDLKDLQTPLIIQCEPIAILERRRDQIVVVSRVAVGTLAVGSADDFQLQDAHVDPQLQQVATVGARDATGLGLAGFKVPVGENAVEVLRGRA